MTNKKTQPAQDAQQITIEEMQTVPALLSKIFTMHSFAESRRTTLEIDEPAPAELYAALQTNIEKLQTLAINECRPQSIAIVALTAARISKRCCHYTGSKLYADLNAELTTLCTLLNGNLDADGQSVEIIADMEDPQTGEIIKCADFILPGEIEKYRKASPRMAAEWESQQPTQAAKISSGIAITAFEIDMLKDPETALLSYIEIPRSYYNRYMANRFQQLVNEVAQETGTDPAQISDKGKRTPEQQQALTEAAAREQISRFDALMASNYMAALNCLADMGVKYKEVGSENDPETVDLKEQTVLYFFAKHRELQSTATACLTNDHIAEIKGILSRLDEFYIQKSQNGESCCIDWLIAFAESESNDPTVQQVATRIKAVSPIKAGYPLDKINRSVWELLSEASENGQISMLPFAVEKRGSNKEATVYFSIDFEDDAKAIYKKPHLDPFDKRAYLAIYAMQEAQGNYMSLEQIWKTMGNTTRPNSRQLQRLNNSLTKMAARIYIDNKDELPVNKKAVHFRYDGALLPFERTTAYINGKLCSSAIHLFREPPLISFAKSRKQITTIPTKILASPANKTDDSLRLEDYLLDNISRIISGKRSNKILYSTLFKYCGADGAKDKMKRSRIKNDLLPRLLDFYKDKKWIKGYTTAADGVTIQY